MTTIDEMKDQIVQLAKKGDANFLELGRVLDEVLSHITIYDGDPVGEQFEELLEQAELGRRKAYYLIKINRAFAKLEIADKRLAAIGWTKLAVLANFVTFENVDFLLGLAEQFNVDKLKAILAKENPRPHTLTFRFTEPEYAVVKPCLLAHGAFFLDSGGLADKESALVKICAVAAKPQYNA